MSRPTLPDGRLRKLIAKWRKNSEEWNARALEMEVGKNLRGHFEGSAAQAQYCADELEALLASPLHAGAVTADIGAVRDAEHNGPLESTDLHVEGRGISLLVNVPVGGHFTYALMVDGVTTHSGTVGPLHAGAEPEEQPKAVTTFTPMVWMLLTNEQRYEEYVRVREMAAALSSSRTSPAFSENETKDVLTALYQDGHVDLVLADRIAALMKSAVR